jgi:hypothetical protein
VVAPPPATVARRAPINFLDRIEQVRRAERQRQVSAETLDAVQEALYDLAGQETIAGFVLMVSRARPAGQEHCFDLLLGATKRAMADECCATTVRLNRCHVEIEPWADIALDPGHTQAAEQEAVLTALARAFVRILVPERHENGFVPIADGAIAPSSRDWPAGDTRPARPPAVA